MKRLLTTLGPKRADELGFILPHEHIFVELAPLEQQVHREARAEDALAVIGPELVKARAAGVTALVECTPVGVGRRADIVRAVSEATGVAAVVPTGIYREPWVPAWVHAASEQALTEWMLTELTSEIETSGVQAAWIKLSAGDEGMTEVERRILRAAAQAGAATGALIGSHTIKGRVVLEQLDTLEAAGYTPERFVWIHTQAEEDFGLHLKAARRGAWLEYDWIGGGKRDDAYYLEHIHRLVEAGFGERLLLSQDRGWYDPSDPARAPKPYTYLSETFLPKLRDAGMNNAMIEQLTHVNPFAAFARDE